jgi:hypothetical protein
MSSINQLSVFIPRVFVNINKARISEIFDKLDLGIIDHIDLVRKRGPNGDYNSAYVHLKYWLKTDASRRFRDNLFNSKDGAKLVYDDPWFWIVLPNTASQKQNQQMSRQQPQKIIAIAPRLDFKLNHKASVYVPRVSAAQSVEPPISRAGRALKKILKISNVQVPTTPPSSPPPQSPRIEIVAPVKLTPENMSLENMSLENMEAAMNFIEELQLSFPERTSSQCLEDCEM